MIDVIPGPVFHAVQEHLLRAANRGEEGWEGGSEEEDTLTGDLCGQLRTGWKRPVTVNGERWRWRVQYKKFRGRGRGALEKPIGADGIVQVEVHRPPIRVTVYKGVLFQAKKGRIGHGKGLIEQVRRMENIAPRSSTIFEYRPDGYRAVAGVRYLASVESGLAPNQLESLGPFLAETFLPCKIGIRGVYYDAVREKLFVPAAEEVRAIDFTIRNRLSIEVEGRR